MQLSSDIWISDIEYADDVVILAENLENLNFILERVNYFSNHIGLQIDLSKSKVLSTCSSVDLTPTLSGSILEVPVFKYLGSSGQTENEVDARIGSARLAFLQLKNISQRRKYSGLPSCCTHCRALRVRNLAFVS